MASKEICECYTIGVEMKTVQDLSVLVIVKREGDICKVINTYYGDMAEKKYEKFIKEFCTPIA